MPRESGGEKEKHRGHETEAEMESVEGAICAIEGEVDGFHRGPNGVAGGPGAWGKEQAAEGVGGREDDEEVGREPVGCQIGGHGLWSRVLSELSFAGHGREFRM